MKSKFIKVPRGTTRAKRNGAAPSIEAQAAVFADQQNAIRRANHKLGVQMYHKSGHGVR